jgi:hypothetical protein
MVMGVDQARDHHVTGEINDLVGAIGKLGGGADGLDPAIPRKKSTIADFPAIHRREEMCASKQQSSHHNKPNWPGGISTR